MVAMRTAESLVPERQPLARQVSLIIIRELGKGTWKGWLPSERSLCETLQVSRNTLRTALWELSLKGILKPARGLGYRILKAPPHSKANGRNLVGLIIPVPLEELRPRIAVWIDDLRAQLHRAGCDLNVYEGKHYLRGELSSALLRLTTRTRHACWILIASSERMQRWFQRQKLPCVVAGTVWPGLDLAYVDVDHRALCRHAATEIIRLGHRQLVFLNPRTRSAGELESEAGFLEGAAHYLHPDLRARVISHDETVESVCRHLKTILAETPRPTAILVSNSYYFVTVVGYLQREGWRVPEDISVISRDDDPFLSYVVPVPSKYSFRPRAYARLLFRPVIQAVKSSPITARRTLIMPDFIRGSTLGPPPGGLRGAA
jgi:LacI family transcriptional regulator